MQGDDARDDPLVDGRDALAGFGDPKAFAEINRLAEHDNRAAEHAPGQPAPQSPGFWSAFAENPFDAVMVHRDDSYRRLSMCDGVGGTVLDDRQVITAGSLIEDEEIVMFQKIGVFAHQPGMPAPFHRNGAQESKKSPGKPSAEEILPGGEIHKREGRVENIFRKIGSYGDEKRIVHGDMIRYEEHPLPALGNIVPSPHAGEIEGEAEEQKGGETGGNHGNVRCPNPQTREYSCDQHDVYSLRSREWSRLQLHNRTAIPELFLDSS